MTAAPKRYEQSILVTDFLKAVHDGNWVGLEARGVGFIIDSGDKQMGRLSYHFGEHARYRGELKGHDCCQEYLGSRDEQQLTGMLKGWPQLALRDDNGRVVLVIESSLKESHLNIKPAHTSYRSCHVV